MLCEGRRTLEELGLDHYQVMSATAILRFWALAILVHVFIEEERQRLQTQEQRPITIGEARRDDHLAFLQEFFQTWRQLAEAGAPNLLAMLSEIRPPDSPGLTLEQIFIIQSFAQEKVRLQEEETT